MEVPIGKITGHREKDSGQKVQTLRYNTTKLLFIYNLLYVYECFARVHICVSHATMPREARRGHWNPLQLELQAVLSNHVWDGTKIGLCCLLLSHFFSSQLKF